MFYYLRYLRAFICRLHHLKGFGIQSPWAFKMVNDVINCHTPFSYAPKISSHFGHIDIHTQRLGRLFYRLSLHIGPTVWHFSTFFNDLYSHYVRLGSHSSTCLSLQDGMNVSSSLNCQVLVVSPDMPLAQDLMDGFVSLCSSECILIVLDIHKTSKHRKLWYELIANPKAGVSFDLFVCGLIFFDHTKSKQNYTINLTA